MWSAGRRGPNSMDFNDFKAGLVVRGAIFPEPVKIITTVAVGDSLKLIGEGTISGKVHQPILTVDEAAGLQSSPEERPYDGDAA